MKYTFLSLIRFLNFLMPRLTRQNDVQPTWKNLIVSLIICAGSLIFQPGINLAHAEKPLPDIPYILVNSKDNTVLLENRIHERWHPASITKLMTAYVTFKAIQKGEISAGSPVTFTKNAANTPPGKMGYKKGTRLRFDTALRILIVKSANDVAVALAESLAGNVPAFVKRMNSEAHRLGLKDTHFLNPNGLHDTNQYISARDMVILSSAIWNEFPQYRDLFETPTITDGKKRYTSYNLLLERFPGTTGMKTGYICAAGFNIVVSAERNNKHLVAVVLGASSQTERAEIAARLLLKGFDNITGKPMADFPRPKKPVGPKSMRKTICSKTAVKNRYNPTSDKAVINSAFLKKRKITKQAVLIQLGNIDGPPSPAWLARAFIPKRIPVPKKRPKYELVDVNGILKKSDTLIRGSIPIPQKSPAVSVVVQ